MKFCPDCGKRFKDSDAFCVSCGTSLKCAEDDNNFTEGLSQAGRAAKDAVENAFNEENREKVKAAANEAMDAIKNADIEKGKAMANEGINKIKSSKYGIVAVIAVILIAAVVFFMPDNSDEGQVKKIAKTYAEFYIEDAKNGIASDGKIKAILDQTEPELREQFRANFEDNKKRTEAKLKRINSDKELKKKYEEVLAKVKNASYEISEIKVLGDRGYAIISFKDLGPIKQMQVFVVRKNDGKWYSGYIFFNDDVQRRI